MSVYHRHYHHRWLFISTWINNKPTRYVCVSSGSDASVALLSPKNKCDFDDLWVCVGDYANLSSKTQHSNNNNNNSDATASPLAWKLSVSESVKCGKYQWGKCECGWECEKWVGKVYLHNVLAVFGLLPCHPTPIPFSSLFHHHISHPYFHFCVSIDCVFFCFVFLHFPPKKFACLYKTYFLFLSLSRSVIVLLLLKSLLNCAENNVETVRHIQIYTHTLWYTARASWQR